MTQGGAVLKVLQRQLCARSVLPGTAAPDYDDAHHDALQRGRGRRARSPPMRGKPSTSLGALALALAVGRAPSHPPGPSEPEWSAPPPVAVVAPTAATTASATDDDGDGITAWNDLCPDCAEDADDFEDEDGCPELDDDDDGRPDSDDACPEIAAATADGCPAGGTVVLADPADQSIAFRPGKADLDADRADGPRRGRRDAGRPRRGRAASARRLPRRRRVRGDALGSIPAAGPSPAAARYLEAKGVAADRLVVRGDGLATGAIQAGLRVRLAVSADRAAQPAEHHEQQRQRPREPQPGPQPHRPRGLGAERRLVMAWASESPTTRPATTRLGRNSTRMSTSAPMQACAASRCTRLACQRLPRQRRDCDQRLHAGRADRDLPEVRDRRQRGRGQHRAQHRQRAARAALVAGRHHQHDALPIGAPM